MSLTTNMTNYSQRQTIDRLMRGLTVVATGLAIVPLVLIIGYVLIVGGSALNVEFFTQTYLPPVTMGAGGSELDPLTGLPIEAGIDPVTGLPVDPNAAPVPERTVEDSVADVQARGGVLHGIIGTALVTLVALLLALPIGLLAGVFLAEYRDNPFANFVRFCCDVLSGAPSIVIGVVGYVLLVQQFKTYSALAGSIALTFLMVPTITRTTEEILKLVPNAIREAAMAMGAPTWYSTFTVVIPTALSGIVTGTLLAFARGAGETAPLLLTIQGSTILSYSLFEPIAALPILTYKYIESPFPSENTLAWGTAFVLMMLVLTVNILVRLATRNRMGGR